MDKGCACPRKSSVLELTSCIHSCQADSSSLAFEKLPESQSKQAKAMATSQDLSKGQVAIYQASDRPGVANIGFDLP